jgi:hypothetical protein
METSKHRAIGSAIAAIIAFCHPASASSESNSAASALAPNGAALIERARESAARARDKSAHVSMTISAGEGRELHRSLTGFEKWTPEGRKTLWVFDSPADLAGTRFLAWRQPEGRELLWVFFPAQGRIRQVTDQMRRERFQGSDFTYEDFATIAYLDYAGTHTFLREEPCGVTTCSVVETELPRERFSYRRLRSWLRHDLLVPHRIEFFTGEPGSDEKLKEVDVLEVDTIDGIPTILAMRAQHADGDSSTTARFSEVQYNTDLADDVFSLAALSHGR